MRFAVVVAFILAFAAAGSARAQVRVPFDIHLDIPQLSLSTDAIGFDLTRAAPAATPSLIVPPRYGWILDDGRAFWFAAGGSSVVALATHVLVGLPTLLIGLPTSVAIASGSPAAFIPFLVGLGGTYMLAEAALAALAATLVFNNVSKVYDGNYVVALAAHVAGSLLGVAVSALTFGVGFMLVGGLQGLVEFTGSAGLGAIEVFSFLGALPAVVIGGIALVGVPALIGAWGMSVAATPKPGYAINPAWKDPNPAPVKEPEPTPGAGATTGAPATSRMTPFLTIPLPG